MVNKAFVLFLALTITVNSTVSDPPTGPPQCDNKAADYWKMFGRHVYTLSPDSPDVKF